MGFGIVSDDVFESNLTHLQKKAEIKDLKIGRGNGNKEVPATLRKVIAQDAIEGAPAQHLSEVFGISPSSISAYKHDATSTASYHTPNHALQESNNKVRNDITDKARKRLIKAIDSITDSKLEDCKARDAAAIAKDMSAVIKNLEPDTPQNQSNVQFVFYAPPMKKEEDYDVVQVD